jgi:hypothetical protein
VSSSLAWAAGLKNPKRRKKEIEEKEMEEEDAGGGGDREGMDGGR